MELPWPFSLLQPVDVAKAADDLAAELEGCALVAEDPPDRFLVIKAGHQSVADLLEEAVVLHTK